MGIIYCAYNKINGKRYIGKTTESLAKRKRGHYSETSSCVYFHRALMKYDREDWEWTIIDSTETDTELAEKEKYWIAFYKSKGENGYNLTDGGEGSPGAFVSEENKRQTRESMLKSTTNHYNDKKKLKVLGVKCIETGESYISYSAAGRAIGIYYSKIREAALSNGEKSAGGFH